MMHVHREPHAQTTAFRGRVHQCVQAISSGFTPHHLAYYSLGVCNFAVDVLQRPTQPAEPAAPAAAGTTSADIQRRRAVLREVGGELSCVFIDLDRELSEARTGQLIRMVLHAQQGVIYCMAVTPREQVLGVVLARADRRPLTGQASVRQADREVSDLADQIRADLSLSQLNYGGWHTERPARVPLSAGQRSLQAPKSAVPRLQGEGTRSIVRKCTEALDPEHLLFIGLYKDQDCQFSVDILDHPTAARFFTEMSPGERRRYYTELWQRFSVIYGELAQSVRPAIKGNLIRTVFDVEQGAIFCYRVGPGEYLVGVVIDQDRVSEADDGMSELAAWCEETDWRTDERRPDDR